MSDLIERFYNGEEAKTLITEADAQLLQAAAEIAELKEKVKWAMADRNVATQAFKVKDEQFEIACDEVAKLQACAEELAEALEIWMCSLPSKVTEQDRQAFAHWKELENS